MSRYRVNELEIEDGLVRDFVTRLILDKKIPIILFDRISGKSFVIGDMTDLDSSFDMLSKIRYFHQEIKECQVCHGKIGTVFYDAAIRGGQWGYACHSCYQSHCYPKPCTKWKKFPNATHYIKVV